MKKRIFMFLTACSLVFTGLVIPEPETAYAASTQISSAEDLLAMEQDPSGDYVLTKDITVPKDTNLFVDTPFTGTLDGKGHKLKGYRATTSNAIFAKAKSAEFKNLSITNVDIKTDSGVAALVYDSEGCTFKNISVSGKITVRKSDSWTWKRSFGTLAATGSGSMEKCKNSASITIKDWNECYVGGLAGNFDAARLKDCSNSGKITLGTKKKSKEISEADITLAGLVAGEVDVVTSCKNAGDITLKVNGSMLLGKSLEHSATLSLNGICYGANKITSSGNTGKIMLTSAKSAKYDGRAFLAGIADGVGKASKCYNTGSVSFTGAGTEKIGEMIRIGEADTDNAPVRAGGLFNSSSIPNKATIGGVYECYNTGNLSVTLFSGHSGVCMVGGIITYGNRMHNCYNTGNLTINAKCPKKNLAVIAGGLQGVAFVGETGKLYVTQNYSTGAVKKAKLDRPHDFQALLVGNEENWMMDNKPFLSDNYYTKSGWTYASGFSSKNSAKKVSSITFGSCPKLSSKYWVYSAKHKRLILKNNKEK